MMNAIIVMPPREPTTAPIMVPTGVPLPELGVGEGEGEVAAACVESDAVLDETTAAAVLEEVELVVTLILFSLVIRTWGDGTYPGGWVYMK
jgi:hypothetical protein